MLTEPKCLPAQPLEAVADMGFAAGSPNGYAESRSSGCIGGHVKAHKPFTNRSFMLHYTLKIRFASDSLFFSKNKTGQSLSFSLN